MATLRHPRPPRQVRLLVEELERRELLSASAPTAVEQYMLERLNDARANPAAYGAAIGLNLSNVAPSQPLAINALLTSAAQGHSLDMSVNNYFSHFVPGSNASPGDRIAAAGYSANTWGESIAAGYSTPDDALAGLIIDAGVPDLGHRIHLLALDSTAQAQKEVGVGIILNGTGQYHNYYTIDTAATVNTPSFLTGSAFNDVNHNGRYDIGEGLGGVTITVAGVGSVTTFGSGGYSIALAPGTYTVTASGPGLATETTTVTIGGSNVRVNFTPQGVLGAAAPVGGSAASGTLVGSGHYIATGTDRGGPPQVNVYDAVTGQLVASFNAFPSFFTGGVRVAVGDVNGDGTDDIVVGAGPGAAPQVTVFDGKSFQPIRAFMALPSFFTGGVFVAAGDVNGDGFADVVTSADAGGGPQVVVQSGRDGSVLANFYATAPFFTGGIRVSCGDINGDGFADVVAAAGPGAGPQVTVFDGRSLSVITAFYAFAPFFTGGMYIAVGDVNGDGRADIVAGADKGGGPQVTIFNGPDHALLGSFFALPPFFTGGVRVALVDRNGDGRADIITAAGAGGGPQVASFDAATLASLDSFYAYSQGYSGGVFLGAN